MVAAIATNIWSTYEKDAKHALDSNETELLIIQNEVGPHACRHRKKEPRFRASALTGRAVFPSARATPCGGPQKGTVMVTRVSRYLLIMQARETVELGMLKAKVGGAARLSVLAMHAC